MCINISNTKASDYKLTEAETRSYLPVKHLAVHLSLPLHKLIIISIWILSAPAFSPNLKHQISFQSDVCAVNDNNTCVDIEQFWDLM